MKVSVLGVPVRKSGGGAIALGSVIAFFGPMAFFVAMEIMFISREERAMEEGFGKKYLDYKKRVRRWV